MHSIYIYCRYIAIMKWLLKLQHWFIYYYILMLLLLFCSVHIVFVSGSDQSTGFNMNGESCAYCFDWVVWSTIICWYENSITTFTRCWETFATSSWCWSIFLAHNIYSYTHIINSLWKLSPIFDIVNKINKLTASENNIDRVEWKCRGEFAAHLCDTPRL